MATVLITGGCGFIGVNLVLDRLERGDVVRVLDNCSRRGVDANRRFLAERAKTASLELVDGDVRDSELVGRLVKDVDLVFHLAAQTAVTTSVEQPRRDFEVNAAGTLNVLEAARKSDRSPGVIYASTNKVYGSLHDLAVAQTERRYELKLAPFGVSESQPLDFHSPYGCSKGAADQYVLDYSRIYGLKTVSFRQSCIYGPWQYGNEDQGWIAHFLIKVLRGEEITIFGDGRQVRDVLFVGDLLSAFQRAAENLDAVSGRAYNIGGGPAHTTSVVECLLLLEEMVGKPALYRTSDWRPGDQRVYVSDVRRAAKDFGWRPTIPFAEGLRQLANWVTESSALSVVPTELA